MSVDKDLSDIQKYQIALKISESNKPKIVRDCPLNRIQGLVSPVKRYKAGKKKRYKKLQGKLNNQGFGVPWSADIKWFRVEFSHHDRETGEESNYLDPHWVGVRQFKGEERKYLTAQSQAYSQRVNLERETIESHFCCIYVSNYLCSLVSDFNIDIPVYRKLPKDFDGTKINQAFIYPAPAKGNKSFRDPMYHIQAAPDICQQIDPRIAATLRNAIVHEY